MLHRRRIGYGRGVAFADLLARADVVEEQVLASSVGFLALHGGLEPGTAEIARAAAGRAGASCYAIVQPDDLKHHVPSHETDPACSPLLAGFLAHVDTLVSVHGYWGHDDLHSALLVGGGDRELASELARRLRVALPEYRVLDDLDRIPRRLRGVDPRNPVNCASRGGVQVELPHPVRAIGPYGHGERGEIHRTHTEALVDTLAGFARDLAGG
ncbi:MAG: hypothetical protein QOF40_1540 [Actinomycetota bacterium]|nr:hypothetical protein [Actinomycetota bacterium]